MSRVWLEGASSMERAISFSEPGGKGTWKRTSGQRLAKKRMRRWGG